MVDSPSCWWKKSCTTWDVSKPVSNGIKLPMLIAARFLPSTVSQDMAVQLRKLQELQDYLQSIGVEKTLVAAVDGSLLLVLLSFCWVLGPMGIGKKIRKGGSEVGEQRKGKTRKWGTYQLELSLGSYFAMDNNQGLESDCRSKTSIFQ